MRYPILENETPPADASCNHRACICQASAGRLFLFFCPSALAIRGVRRFEAHLNRPDPPVSHANGARNDVDLANARSILEHRRAPTKFSTMIGAHSFDKSLYNRPLAGKAADGLLD